MCKKPGATKREPAPSSSENTLPFFTTEKRGKDLSERKGIYSRKVIKPTNKQQYEERKVIRDKVSTHHTVTKTLREIYTSKMKRHTETLLNREISPLRKMIHPDHELHNTRKYITRQVKLPKYTHSISYFQ
jgi:hypothetical protein